jgi:hypothetical protein
MLPGKDAVLSGDLARLEEVRRQREEKGPRPISAPMPPTGPTCGPSMWTRPASNTPCGNLSGRSDIGTLVDLGTGTGRVLELFGGVARDPSWH